MGHQVGSTLDGMTVEVDLSISAAAKQISRHPHILSLASEALSKITPDGSLVTITYDMGRTIGYDFVVEVTDLESVFYAQAVKGSTFIPFTKKGSPKPTQLLTMILEYGEAYGNYSLSDIWIGPVRPPHPEESDDIDKSKTYWEKHAYVFGDQPIKVSTITRTCPY